MSLFESFTKRARRPDRSLSDAERRKARRAGRPGLEGLEDRQLMTLGAPFGVDSEVLPAFESANATSTNGMSVAVWTRKFNDQDNDIRAQLYAPGGAKIGGEIVVENGSLDDSSPAVAMDAQGNFVVAWAQSSGGLESNIIARRFDSHGAPRDVLSIPVANSAKRESEPDVAMDAQGNFVVSYTLAFSNTDLDVRARRFNKDGGSLGTTFVATTSTFDESEASVATTPNGGFVVAYTREDNQGTSVSPDVILSRFDAQGNRLSTNGDIKIASTSLEERDADVAVDAFGNMVVAYQKFTGGTITIRAKRVGVSGLPGSEIAIATDPAFLSFDPSVAMNRLTGSFVVTYSQDSQDGSIRRAEVAEVSGTTNTVAFRQTLFDANEDRTAVSMDPNGNYFVTYTRGVDPNFTDNHIFGRRGRRL